MPDKWAQYAQPSTTDRWAKYAVSSSDGTPPPPALSDNPSGEGTYSMHAPDGTTVGIPFSNVQEAQRRGYLLSSDDSKRYGKDFGATQSLWDRVNSPLNMGHLQESIAKADYAAQGPHTLKELQDAENHPIISAVKTGINSVGADAARMLLTPLGVGLTAIGGVGAAGEGALASDLVSPTTGRFLKPLVSGAKVLTGAAGVGGVGMAGDDVIKHPLPDADESTADYVKRLSGDAALALGGAAGVSELGSGLRPLLAGDLDAPIAGTSITPRQRYEAAKRTGVQLDAADATNSTPLQIAKRINRNSLLGYQTYDDAAARNLSALHTNYGDMLSSMFPGDSESGGKLIQDNLLKDLEQKKQIANDGFAQLSEDTNGAPVPGAASVGSSAQSILEAKQPFFDNYESLAPRTSLGVLKDLSKVGDTASYEDLQRLRSGVFELTHANPDLVKNDATGWLKSMTGTLDDAISEKGLTPDQLETFRGANDAWRDLKQNYDDPQSPLYSAVRTNAPSRLVNGIGGQAPETLRNLLPRIGEDGQGALQRGVLESLVSNGPNGEPNLRGFSRRLYSMPDAYRETLFGPTYSGDLDDLASTVHALSADFNPSGSGKEIQKTGEALTLGAGFAGHPAALAPLAQYPLAKLINSPRFTEWLMHDPYGPTLKPILSGGDGSEPDASRGAGLKPMQPGVAPVASVPDAPMPSAPSASRTQPSSAQAKNIRAVVDAAKSGGEKVWRDFSPVSPWLVDAASAAGQDIDGYVHSIHSDAVRHALREHGGEAETQRGQIPLTSADFERIPQIVADPDRVIFGGNPSRRGLDTIAYVKRMDDGTIAHVEEQQTGRQKLSAVTMFKYPAGQDVDRLAEHLQQNVRNGGGRTESMIVPGPSAGKAENAVPTTAAQRISGVDGAETELHVPGGSGPARYRVVEADSLIPSHDARSFRPDPRYPSGVQERDYAGSKEAQLRVISHAQDYKPSLTVTDNPDGINGPPVTLPNGVVLGGNSRVMSTQRLYAAGGDAYKNYLTDRAQQFGVDPDQVRQMSKPMLVREIDHTNDTGDMRALGSLLNKPMTGAMSTAERAVSMGAGVSPQTLRTVGAMLKSAGDDATLRDVLSEPTHSNALLMRLQGDGIVSPEERPEFTDPATGGMNEDGKKLLERALLGTVVGDPQVLERAPKHVLQKLNGAIGPLADIASRQDDWNILPDLRRAIAEHSKIAASGISVGDHLNQSSVFSKPLPPKAETLTRALAGNPNAVRDAFASYGRDSRHAIPGQTSFLGPSADEAFDHAFESAFPPGVF